jgi:hypothetical protein
MRLVIVTGSVEAALVLVTVTVKVNVPPGVGRLLGLTVLSTLMLGVTSL